MSWEDGGDPRRQRHSRCEVPKVEEAWWVRRAEGEAGDEGQKVMEQWGHLLTISSFFTEKGRKRWREVEGFPNCVWLSSNKTKVFKS